MNGLDWAALFVAIIFIIVVSAGLISIARSRTGMTPAAEMARDHDDQVIDES